MPYSPEPEVLPPLRRGQGQLITNEQLDQLATILDDIFQVPGTKLRFGLDALLGLIPGLGDILSSLMSFLIVFAAWQRGLPQVTLARMMVNIAIDTLLGSFPIVGDAFDVVWKSNRMNYNLLLRATREPEKSHSWKDWLFLMLLVIFAATLLVLPVLALVWLVRFVLR